MKYLEQCQDFLGLRRHRLSGEAMRILILLKSYWQWESNQHKAVLPEVQIASLFPDYDKSDYLSSSRNDINHYGRKAPRELEGGAKVR
jgi:hypothetical protein